MRIPYLMAAVVLCTLTTTVLANNRNCRDISNDRAREACFEQNRNNNGDLNCNDFKNERARENCRDRQHSNNNNRNCNDLKNERARQRCWDENSNSNNNNWSRPNRPSNSTGRTLSEAQQFCASAGRADDHAACMSSQGFPQRR